MDGQMYKHLPIEMFVIIEYVIIEYIGDLEN